MGIFGPSTFDPKPMTDPNPLATTTTGGGGRVGGKGLEGSGFDYAIDAIPTITGDLPPGSGKQDAGITDRIVGRLFQTGERLFNGWTDKVVADVLGTEQTVRESSEPSNVDRNFAARAGQFATSGPGVLLIAGVGLIALLALFRL